MVSVPSPIKLPPPSAHPSYPPVDLGDLVALSQQGTSRRFLGATAALPSNQLKRKMEVIFEATENQASPGDWDITVDAPSE